MAHTDTLRKIGSSSSATTNHPHYSSGLHVFKAGCGIRKKTLYIVDIKPHCPLHLSNRPTNLHIPETHDIMTPAIDLLKKKKITHTVHSYQHEPNHPSYGKEAAEKLGFPAQQVFKTLVAELGDGTLAVAIIPVDQMLGMKQLAKAASAKKAAMADRKMVEKTTGYVLGGVSPLGQKKLLKTILDSSAHDFATICVSAGRRGLEIELSPNDLLNLTRGITAPLCQEE